MFLAAVSCGILLCILTKSFLFYFSYFWVSLCFVCIIFGQFPVFLAVFLIALLQVVLFQQLIFSHFFFKQQVPVICRQFNYSCILFQFIRNFISLTFFIVVIHELCAVFLCTSSQELDFDLNLFFMSSYTWLFSWINFPVTACDSYMFSGQSMFFLYNPKQVFSCCKL